MSDDIHLHWSNDHILLAATLSVAQAHERLKVTTARWVIVGDLATKQLSACETAEALTWLEQVHVDDVKTQTLATVLQLDTSRQAAVAHSRTGVVKAHPNAASYVHAKLQTWVPYIVIEDQDTVLLGGTHVGRRSTDRGAGGLPIASSTDDTNANGIGSQREDDGAHPIRYPDIHLEEDPLPGRYLEVIVDALLEKSDHTRGGALNISALDDDWSELELKAHISCPLIEFDNSGQGIVTVFRNEPSVAAVFRGVVSNDAVVGQALSIDVGFFHEQRFCGAAHRSVVVGGTSDEQDQSESLGMVSVDINATSPDATVYITRHVSDASYRLSWRVVTLGFDGLPPRLDGDISLGSDPASTASRLFAHYEQLQAGEHLRAIYGFGTKLWNLSPAFFKDVYWAMHAHYGRRLNIQFVTDDPYLPWELMRPAKEDDSEIHRPLAVQHCTGRWLRNWEGYMPASIEAGRLYTLAPNYVTGKLSLPYAQAESQMLVDQFAAIKLGPDRDDLFRFLEDKVTTDRVAMLHFAGHGRFNAQAVSESYLELEDGLITASEIGVPEVTLGKRCRTLVFFNACELGASGDLLGVIGGWAEVFLKRQFGGFIAPLWAINDQDAPVVAKELVEGVLVRREPIGEVLRTIRETHGDVSPMFYSYLYYGDVMARVEESS